MLNYKFFSHFAAESNFNMAFDEWMLSEVLAGKGSIFLRLYSWREGTITFGANQNQATALDFEMAGATPVIRRVTGGRALYHDPSEITYAIAVSEEFLAQVEWGKSISQSSKQISEILVMFLKDIGISSHFMRRSAPGSNHRDIFHKAPCFDSYARHEILSGSEKIIASAQRRVRGGLLQHGAIKINGSKSHPAVPLAIDNSNSANILNSLKQAEFEQLADLFKKCFETNLNGKFMIEELDKSEQAEVLNREKYVLKNSLLKRELIKQKMS